jgi:cytochrome oxidase Cu insertion factor (SCO1/SenC/PrrC family)
MKLCPEVKKDGIIFRAASFIGRVSRPSRRSRRSVKIFRFMRRALIFFLLLAATAFAQQRLPAPQIPSAAGKPAPDFTLRDQHGRAVHLASLRGHPVLLVFYRGYW